jgi:lipoyl(octanoyl) transferase
MLKIKQLKGIANYEETLNKMNSKVLEVSEDIKKEEIWILEHQKVYTAGSSTPKEFKIKKINDIPVINIIENLLIKVFEQNNIKLFTIKETNRGLWTKDQITKKNKKIVFIGLRYSKGVIYHGISINFDLHLVNFKKINPCGLNAGQISSLKELKIKFNKEKIINELIKEFINQFDLNLI